MPAPSHVNAYLVKKGDSLWGIAEKFLGDPLRWTEVAAINKLDPPFAIFAGMSLKLPSGKKPQERAASAPLTSTRSVKQPSTTAPLPQWFPKQGAFQATPDNTAVTHAMSAKQIAKLVEFPKWNYYLKDLPSQTFHFPTCDMVLRLTGVIGFQKKGNILDNIEFSEGQIKVKYQTPATKALSALVSEIVVEYDNATKTVKLKGGLVGKLTWNGQTMATSSFTIIPPGTLRYSYKAQIPPQEVDGFTIDGSFGFEADVTPRGKFNPQLIPITNPFIAPPPRYYWIPDLTVTPGQVRRFGECALKAVLVVAVIAAGWEVLTFVAAARLAGVKLNIGPVAPHDMSNSKPPIL